MREIAEQSLGWLVLAGIVLAVILAKRRYENRFEQRVEASAQAKLDAHLAATGGSASVNVAVDASHRGATDPHQCTDLFTCAVCAPIALRVLMAADRSGLGVGGPRPRLTTGIDHDNDHDARPHHDATLVGAAGGGVGDNRGSGARGRGPGADVRRGLDLEGAPCASVNEISPLSDLLARPWAYDEPDPRCEVTRAESRGA